MVKRSKKTRLPSTLRANVPRQALRIYRYFTVTLNVAPKLAKSDNSHLMLTNRKALLPPVSAHFLIRSACRYLVKRTATRSMSQTVHTRETLDRRSLRIFTEPRVRFPLTPGIVSLPFTWN